MPPVLLDPRDDDGESFNRTNDHSDDKAEWETSSELSSPILSVEQPPSLVSVARLPDQAEIEISSGPNDRTPDQSRPSALDNYFFERAKFIKHLEKRAKKFTKKSREDYDRARWGKQKQKPATPVKPSPQPAQAPQPTVAPIQNKSEKVPEMLASTSKAFSKAVASASTSSRAFSTTAPSLAKAKQNTELSLDVLEAIRVCKSLEISSPHAAFTLKVQVYNPDSKKFPSMRGRVTLPKNPRRTTDRILVFAEANSASAELARKAGVTYVGADDLFEPLLKGEIDPTKVLATPGILPVVTANLARFLGPKGLMPTTRRGGVGEGEELVNLIREARGATDWKTDDRGCVMTPIGRMNFEIPEVESNIRALTASLRESLNVNAPSSSMDEHLLSRKQVKAKKTVGVHDIQLLTTNGVKVSLNDAFSD